MKSKIKSVIISYEYKLKENLMYGPPLKPQKSDIPKPKSFKEFFPYLWKLFASFISRYAFIFKLVWEASPFILIVMMLMKTVC